jgi:hypothetical protein
MAGFHSSRRLTSICTVWHSAGSKTEQVPAWPLPVRRGKTHPNTRSGPTTAVSVLIVLLEVEAVEALRSARGLRIHLTTLPSVTTRSYFAVTDTFREELAIGHPANGPAYD